MALDLSGLTAYVDENKMDLIKKSILRGRSTEFLTVQADIKKVATINIFEGDLVAQAGGCGWNEDGDVTITQRELRVTPIKINESICVSDLENYYTQKMLNPGSKYENLPFEGIYAEEKSDKLNELIDNLIWNGDTLGATGSGNLTLVDGLLKLVTAETANTVDGNTGSETSITAANVIAVMDAMVGAVPADIIDREDLYIFVGYDIYRMYALALRNANLFHYTGTENQGMDFSQYVPGTNVRIVAIKALNGKARPILTTKANIYMGVDLLNEEDDFEIWHDKSEDEVRFRSKFKLGVQIAFPEFVVDFKV